MITCKCNSDVLTRVIEASKKARADGSDGGHAVWSKENEPDGRRRKKLGKGRADGQKAAYMTNGMTMCSQECNNIG